MTQSGPKVPVTSGRPRAKVDSLYRHRLVEVLLQLSQVQRVKLNYVCPLPKYKSLCDWGSHLVPRVLCALSRGCLVLSAISAIAWHDTTHFVNHTPTILYQGTNLYPGKCWPEIPKLSQVQICSRYMIVRICLTQPVVSCPAMWEILCRTAPAECRQHTSHVVRRASIPQALVFG